LDPQADVARGHDQQNEEASTYRQDGHDPPSPPPAEMEGHYPEKHEKHSQDEEARLQDQAPCRGFADDLVHAITVLLVPGSAKGYSAARRGGARRILPARRAPGARR